jgi:TM2 domain-containing membrane protein YozV
MKIVAFILNIFVPGLGTLLVGKIGSGLIQLALCGLALALMWTVVFWIIGAPLYAIAWVWGLISVGTAPDRVEVIVRDPPRRIG